MKNYKLLMNQIALVIGLLFFLITAIPLTLGQVDLDSEIDFRFTYLMSDKTVYEAGETVEFEAWIVNNSTKHDLAIYFSSKRLRISSTFMPSASALKFGRTRWRSIGRANAFTSSISAVGRPSKAARVFAPNIKY